jgi:hypothetical protein
MGQNWPTAPSAPTAVVNRTRHSLPGVKGLNSHANAGSEGSTAGRLRAAFRLFHNLFLISPLDAQPGMIHEPIERNIEDLHADACARDFVPDLATWMSGSLSDENDNHLLD